MPNSTDSFSSSDILPVLDEACRQVGLPSQGSELLRLGENAIYRLEHPPVVVRIARSIDHLSRVERELCVARWLNKANVPAVRVYESTAQAIIINGHPVTFWHAVTGGDPVPTHADLARLLAAFHALNHFPCDFPHFDPLRTSKSRLERAANVAPDDRAFLSNRCVELESQLHKLDFQLPYGPIHGDAHTGNLLTDNERVVLSDFEATAIGPREWDLLPTAIARDRYGLPERRYQDFVDAYGFDVRAWAGYALLREVRELTMTTWIMQNVNESPAVAAEFALRVTTLRERDFNRAWNFF